MLLRAKRHPLLSLLLIGLILRLLVYVTFNFGVYDGEFEHPDSNYYFNKAEQVNSYLAGDDRFESSVLSIGNYGTIIGFLFYIGAPTRYIPEAISMLSGMLLILVAYKTVWNLTRNLKASIITGGLIAVDPYLTYLSTQFLKDTTSVLIIALLFLGMSSKNRKTQILGGLTPIIFFLIRTRLVIVLGGAVLIFLLAWIVWTLIGKKQVLSILPILVFLAAIPVATILSGAQIKRDILAYTVDDPGKAAIIENIGRPIEFEGDIQPSVQHTKFFEPRSATSLKKMISLEAPAGEYILGIVDSLTFPRPWKANNLVEYSFSLYMLYWYFLLIVLFLAFFKSSQATTIMIPLFLIGLLLAFVITIPNPSPGPLVRWRLNAFYPITLVAGVALAQLPSAKRIFDVIVASIFLLILSPLWILLSLSLYSTRGQVYFVQDRIGENRKVFRLYKFITMTPDSDGRIVVMNTDDTRITWLGRILRKTAIDEIPELLNVLKGDMSIVGPRPLAVWEDTQIQQDANGTLARWKERNLVRPGMTGLAQVKSNRSDNVRKLSWDLEYIERRNMWLDIKVFLQSFRVIGKWV